MAIWHGATVYFGTVYGLEGPNDASGITYPHWWTSSIAFSVIIHIVVMKCFMETYHWNGLVIGAGAFAIVSYYITVFGLSSEFVSNILQPELNQEFMRIFGNAKAVFTIVCLPFVALIPDFTYNFIQKLFFPTPTDFVMQIQKRMPDYEWTKFQHIEHPDYS